MGLPIPEPDEAVYTDAELESARMIHVAREAGITDAEQLDLLRVLGRGLSQAAETLRALPLRLVLEPGISEVELAQQYATAAAALYPLVNPLVSSLLVLHLRHATQSTVVSELERHGGRLPGSREIAVCFADLVGFTRLGEEIPAEELGGLAARLEVLAGDVAEPPVRLVKTIGDAAMLASPEPEALLGAALSLVDEAERRGRGLPSAARGRRAGPALLRAGDWFGRPVNLASRITSVARPGSVLAEHGLRESAGESYRWSFAGERHLRGVREPVRLFRARRLPGPPRPQSPLSRPRRSRAGGEPAGRGRRQRVRPCPVRARGRRAPRRPPRVPQVVERNGVLVGVHALPEALVAVGAQLPVGGEPRERLALEHAVGAQVVEHTGLEAEEAAVDPVLGTRLLAEARHASVALRAR